MSLGAKFPGAVSRAIQQSVAPAGCYKKSLWAASGSDVPATQRASRNDSRSLGVMLRVALRQDETWPDQPHETVFGIAFQHELQHSIVCHNPEVSPTRLRCPSQPGFQVATLTRSLEFRHPLTNLGNGLPEPLELCFRGLRTSDHPSSGRHIRTPFPKRDGTCHRLQRNRILLFQSMNKFGQRASVSGRP